MGSATGGRGAMAPPQNEIGANNAFGPPIFRRIIH